MCNSVKEPPLGVQDSLGLRGLPDPSEDEASFQDYCGTELEYVDLARMSALSVLTQSLVHGGAVVSDASHRPHAARRVRNSSREP